MNLLRAAVRFISPLTVTVHLLLHSQRCQYSKLLSLQRGGEPSWSVTLWGCTLSWVQLMLTPVNLSADDFPRQQQWGGRKREGGTQRSKGWACRDEGPEMLHKWCDRSGHKVVNSRQTIRTRTLGSILCTSTSSLKHNPLLCFTTFSLHSPFYSCDYTFQKYLQETSQGSWTLPKKMFMLHFFLINIKSPYLIVVLIFESRNKSNHPCLISLIMFF